MPSCKRWRSDMAAAATALLVCAAIATAANTNSPGNAAVAAKPVPPRRHRCIFGELQAKMVSTGTSRLARVVSDDDGDRLISRMRKPQEVFQPLRIHVSDLDLSLKDHYCTKAGQTRSTFNGRNYTCREEDFLTEKKRSILRNQVVPDAARLHSERLLVERVNGRILVSDMHRDILCQEFTVPSLHRTSGVARADFLLYIAVGQTLGMSAAWATSCQFLTSGRPVVGAAVFAPEFIAADPRNVRLASHEILHALGFSPLSFINANMLTTRSVRGKPDESPGLNSSKVLAAARTHYGCPTLDFVELEDEGGDGTAGAHWERRNFKEDLMCSIIGVGYYTTMTLAAMEDLGYYRANYAKAEVMPWGRNAGCKLFEEKCVKDGVSQFPSMFCTDPQQYGVCTSDRRGIGYCGTQKYNETLPSAFRYFKDPTLGSVQWSLTDGCPVIELNHEVRCFNGDATYLSSSLMGKNARCFDTQAVELSMESALAQRPSAICADVKCGKCSYYVRVRGSKGYVSCKPGTLLSLPVLSSVFNNGTLTCPPFNEVCTDSVNPSAAAGPFTPSCPI